MKELFFYAFCFQLLAFATSYTNAKYCYNCVSRQYQTVLDKYLDRDPPSEFLMFPYDKHSCESPRKIICEGECASVKIEETFIDDRQVGYFFGCASHVFDHSILKEEPVAFGEKICQKPSHFRFDNHHTANLTYCRCSGAKCNNPFIKFLEAESAADDIPTKFPKNLSDIFNISNSSATILV